MTKNEERACTPWQSFDAAYKKACESSQPNDWMQAALLAQQVRNAVSERGEFEKMADVADKSQERAIEAIQQNVELEADAERYRWLRDRCNQARRIEIAECADTPAMLDHHIDKGRCGL